MMSSHFPSQEAKDEEEGNLWRSISFSFLISRCCRYHSFLVAEILLQSSPNESWIQFAFHSDDPIFTSLHFFLRPTIFFLSIAISFFSFFEYKLGGKCDGENGMAWNGNGTWDRLTMWDEARRKKGRRKIAWEMKIWIASGWLKRKQTEQRSNSSNRRECFIASVKADCGGGDEDCGVLYFIQLFFSSSFLHCHPTREFITHQKCSKKNSESNMKQP